MSENPQGDIIIYQTDDGDTKIDVRFVDETFWLTLLQMAEFFGANSPTINKHLKNIYEEGELTESATVSKMEIVQTEGNRQVKRSVTSITSMLLFLFRRFTILIEINQML